MTFNVYEDIKENIMNKFFRTCSFRLLAAVALVAAAPLAMAHSDVSWSVNIGTPFVAAPVYTPPPAVYVQPQPVYVQPAPVYVRPQPVYVQPAAVVQYGQPYYVERRGRHHHWKHYRD